MEVRQTRLEASFQTKNKIQHKRPETKIRIENYDDPEQPARTISYTSLYTPTLPPHLTPLLSPDTTDANHLSPPISLPNSRRNSYTYRPCKSDGQMSPKRKFSQVRLMFSSFHHLIFPVSKRLPRLGVHQLKQSLGSIMLENPFDVIENNFNDQSYMWNNFFLLCFSPFPRKRERLEFT